MDTVTVGQHFHLTLHGRQDITGGSALMLYRKPGASANAEIEVEVLDPVQASCRALFTPALNKLPHGIWKAWLKLIFSDGKIGYSVRPFRFRTVVPGT